MKKVLIIDTCLLCVWLKVPGMESCGSDNDVWDFQRVNQKIQAEIAISTILVLPLAVVVETGNHIAQAKAKQYETAQEFAKIMTFAADETTPWAAFGEQIVLWEGEQLKKLAAEFPENAKQKTSMGDASIVNLGKHYQQKSFHVEFLTADEGLKAQEPPLREPPTRRSDRRR
ncbi:MAG: hypothetical protein KME31_13445 [Tolypothrix carrinoi HA7290-LM1]|jgi:hypothetical protein|nr:hypothetical protein [Tolypothrix carrinoi HA7290-LM1]